MKQMKKLVGLVGAVVALVTMTACQSTGNTTTKEEKVVVAAKAYMEGFVQGDESKYNSYYGTEAFNKEIDKQLKTVPENEKEIAKKIINKSKAVYKKAEIKSIEKKDDDTITLKIKGVNVENDAILAWTQKNGSKYQSTLQGEAAQEELFNMMGDMFDAMASGEIKTSLKEEKSYDIDFKKEDEKLVPVKDFTTISGYFYTPQA